MKLQSLSRLSSSVEGFKDYQMEPESAGAGGIFNMYICHNHLDDIVYISFMISGHHNY